jgi:hypothetical protein
MKKSKQFWAIVAFAALSAAPFVPVAKNLIKIRSAVLFDDSIAWKQGSEIKYKIPKLSVGDYELRMESAISDWQPIVSVSVGLRDLKNAREVMPIASPTEITLTRPIAKIHIPETTSDENELTVIFGNSNPESHALRIKLSRDRDSLLAESTREFGIVLAISLVLMLFLWKPLTTPV